MILNTFRYHPGNRPAWTDLARQKREALSIDEGFEVPYTGADVGAALAEKYATNRDYRIRAWQQTLGTAGVEGLPPDESWGVLYVVTIRGYNSGPVHNLANLQVPPYMAGALHERMAVWNRGAGAAGVFTEDIHLDNFNAADQLDPATGGTLTAKPQEDITDWNTGLAALAFYVSRIAPGVTLNMPYRTPGVDQVLRELAARNVNARYFFEHFPGTRGGEELQNRLKWLSEIGLSWHAMADPGIANMRYESVVASIWACAVIAARNAPHVCALSIEPSETEGKQLPGETPAQARERVVSATLEYNEGFGAKYRDLAYRLGNRTSVRWATRTDPRIVAEFEKGRVTLTLTGAMATAKWEVR